MCLQVIKEVKIKKENHLKVAKKLVEIRMKLGNKISLVFPHKKGYIVIKIQLYHFKKIFTKVSMYRFCLEEWNVQS